MIKAYSVLLGDNMSYILITYHPNYLNSTVSIITDSDGMAMVFSTEKEAVDYANNELNLYWVAVKIEA